MRNHALVICALLLLPGCSEAPDVEPVQLEKFAAANVGGDAEGVGEGERIARILGCFGCHGSDLQGKIWDEEPEFGIFSPSNLTRSAAQYSDAELELMIREGVRPDGSVLWEMPSEAFTKLSAEDMKFLIAYLNASPPAGPERARPTFGTGAREEMEQGILLSAKQKVATERAIEPWSGGEQHSQGRYVAQMACGECHGPALEGNSVPYRPDLIIAANYSLETFKHLLRTGETPDGRDLGLMAQVAKSRFSHLTDGEVEALFGYLLARSEAP